ncbi:MAG: nicotinate-nucleotide--dimethylbenzimidazole phosphoribosyltransferase [Ruminiclostridium sp.]
MLNNLLDKIIALDIDSMKAAQMRLDNLTKPLGSLGKLEKIVVKLSGIDGSSNPNVDNKAIVVMCADNGVVEENVSSCPKSVTAAVTCNFTRGITGVNVFSRLAGSKLVIVDIGVDADIPYSAILNRKIRKGTWNIAKGPAMTREEAIKGILVGIDIVKDLKAEGIKLLGTGEMGIGNTSTSSAVTAVFTGIPLNKLVGIGSGLSKEAFINKIEVIKRAIEINQPDPNDPIDVLAKVGGFDIAGLTGCFLGAAIYRIPIVIDGFISAIAALTAVRIHPGAREYILPSHGSAEPGTEAVMKALDMQPMLNLDMRLGEGTGAALGFQLIDAAIAAYTQMGSFDDAEIEQYVPQE